VVEAQEDETILKSGVSSHALKRFVHPDPPRLIRSANEGFMEKNGSVSRVHRKKLKGEQMPDAICRANAEKSKARSRVKHVFAEQKDRTELFIRTIEIARAKVKIVMANLDYNFKGLVFLQRIDATCRR